MDYANSVKHIERLLDQRRIQSAMQEMGTVLEQMLKDLYHTYLPRLNASDRAAISQIERQFAERYSVHGAQRLTLGQFAGFIRDSGFVERAVAAKLPLRALQATDLRPFIDARNEATHKAVPPSENQARLHYHQLVQFLEEARLLTSALDAMSAATTLKPWTDVVTPHPDIQHGQLELSAYAADLWAVAFGGERCPEVYRTAAAFFDATYLTNNLAGLLGDVVRVLVGGAGDRVLQLRTPFGGGKTHALIALYHLATCSGQQRQRILQEIGERTGTAYADPGPVGIAVIHGVSLDPQAPRRPEPGVTLHTLWGELAYQLGGKPGYELVRAQDEGKSAPGKPVLQQIIGNDPALILLDEILVYAERAQAITVGGSTYGRQVLIFLQTLTETVRGMSKTAMIYSLQASQGEAFGAEGLLAELDHLVSRVDSKREPVSGDEVLKVVQRRLFSDLGPREARAAVARAYAERYRSHIEADDPSGAALAARRMEARILDSYPLHPALLDLMYHRWGSLPSYQRTRGALQFLATAISSTIERPGSAQPLLGPGDVALDDDATRNALFSQVGEREHYSSVLAADITGGERATDVDRRIGEASPILRRLQVGTRMATAAFLYSFGARQGEDRGVVRSDLIAACLSPDLDRNILATTLHELQESLLYLHMIGGRFRFETRPNLNKLLTDQARQYDSGEVLQEVRKRLENILGRTPGSDVRLWPDDADAIPDRTPLFIVAYLGPSWADLDDTERLQRARQWIDTRAGGKRLYKNGLALAIPGAGRLDEVRQQTRLLLAVEALRGAKGRYGFTADQMDDLNERQRRLTGDIQAALKRLYELVVLPVESHEPSDPLRMEIIDLRAQPLGGDKIHERVLEALRHWVFTSVTPAKLAGLTRLGQDTNQTLSAETLVGWCFSFLNFPKLLGVEPIRSAIAEGVRDGIFGYSAALQFDAGGTPFIADHRLVRIDAGIPAHEIDLSATSYLIAPELARRLGQPPAPAESTTITYPGPRPPDKKGNERQEDYIAGPTEAVNEAVPSVQAPRTAASGRRYRLRFTANKQQLFRAYKPLQNLADKTKTLTVTIEVVAEADTPLDASWLRNAVEEPLDEADMSFDGALEG